MFQYKVNKVVKLLAPKTETKSPLFARVSSLVFQVILTENKKPYTNAHFGSISHKWLLILFYLLFFFCGLKMNQQLYKQKLIKEYFSDLFQSNKSALDTHRIERVFSVSWRAETTVFSLADAQTLTGHLFYCWSFWKVAADYLIHTNTHSNKHKCWSKLVV